MAILKAKNNTGEWETVADVSTVEVTKQLVGELKTGGEAWGWGNHKKSINLSEYVGKDEDFIIILSLSQYQNDGGVSYHAWQKSSGLDHLLPFNATNGGLKLMDGIFKERTGSNTTFTYDNDTQTLTMTDDTYPWIYGYHILYAGVKEA